MRHSRAKGLHRSRKIYGKGWRWRIMPRPKTMTRKEWKLIKDDPFNRVRYFYAEQSIGTKL